MYTWHQLTYEVQHDQRDVIFSRTLFIVTGQKQQQQAIKQSSNNQQMGVCVGTVG